MLLKEENETLTNCNQLKLQAEDGEMRVTDVGDAEQIFRLVQSTAFPKPNLSNNGSQKWAISNH